MKSPTAIDHRLSSQLVMLILLTGLPVAMIATNGAKALRAILAPVTGPGGGTASASEVAPTNIPKPEPRTEPLRFGVYDPAGVFAEDKSLKIRHVYISWVSFDRIKLSGELQSLQQQGFELMLTIEPWPKLDAGQPVLDGVLRGDYDGIIDQLVEVLQGLRGPILLSWGHEMDHDLTERYPWSNAPPDKFVAAYRHVVDRMRKQVTLPLRWVWAGVLKDGSLRYWPGDDYVDLIGMPIYSFPSWDQRYHGYIRDFRKTFEEKRKIVETLNKPLIITELGVSGSDDFESFWLHQAFMALDDYRELACVIFFYSRDTEGAWGRELPTPDWRVHPDAIRALVDWNLKAGSRGG